MNHHHSPHCFPITQGHRDLIGGSSSSDEIEIYPNISIMPRPTLNLGSRRPADVGELVHAEESSASERATTYSKKRKAAVVEESSAKRSKGAHKKHGSNANTSEPPKDYIHVRARRGEATDSHSLAERVRREKISDRMKFLQALVPGCNKVTGKAVMLDEIINYVQSLQRQVEFLSMKLATFNTPLDLNMENYIVKEMSQVHAPMPPHSAYPLEATSTTVQPQGSLADDGLGAQCPVNHLDSGLRRMQLPSLDGFGDPSSQLGAFWEDDLHSVVQMGFGQNQEAAFFHGLSPATQMKIEL